VSTAAIERLFVVGFFVPLEIGVRAQRRLGEHEFVNCHETTEHRRSFQVNLSRWSFETADARNFQAMVVDLLRDWGTGLDPGLSRERGQEPNWQIRQTCVGGRVDEGKIPDSDVGRST